MTVLLFCVLFLIMSTASRAEPDMTKCSLDYYAPMPFLREDDGDHFVRTNLTCTTSGILVDLYHNYFSPDYNLDDGRFQLFYQCKSPTGEETNPTFVKNSNFAPFKRTHFNVSTLPASFSINGTTCEVWGCYEESIQFTNRIIHQIENSTCTIIVPTTEPPTVVTTDPPETIDTASPLMSSAPPLMSSSLHPTSSTSMTSLSPTSTLSVLVSTEDKIVPTATPSPSTPNHTTHTVIAVVVVTIIVVLICVLVLVGVVLRMQQVLRKKHSMMKYYDYQEPIDPHFNPIDINSRVKSVVSIVSEFDILMPQTHPSDSTDDDERSQILQGANNNSDTSSVKSIKFVDESSDAKTNENNQQGPPPTNNVEKLEVDDDRKSLELDERPPQTNGYVPSDYLTGRPNPGYMTKDFKPSALPLHSIQQQLANTMRNELHFGGNNKLSEDRFGTQLSMSSLSSGYVTDLTTPSSDYFKYITNPDSGASRVAVQRNPLTSSQYPTLSIDEEQSEEETNSVVYSIGESENDSVECEAVGGVTEHKYTENNVAECSLSLNPLHFEPINYDDLVDEQTAPSYVNTTPGAELYQTQFDNESY